MSDSETLESIRAERDALREQLERLEAFSAGCVFAGGELKFENAALTTRVQALENALYDVLHAWEVESMDPSMLQIVIAKETLESTPALDLAKHDEAVRREVVERMWNNLSSGEMDWDEWLRVAGIPPSAGTPIQEPGT